MSTKRVMTNRETCYEAALLLSREYVAGVAFGVPANAREDHRAAIANAVMAVADDEQAALRAENARLRLSLAWVRDHADLIEEIIDGSNFRAPRNLRVAVKDLRTVVRLDLAEIGGLS